MHSMDGKMQTYYVYILTNASNHVLYTGVTNNLEKRLYQHRNGMTPGFASKYRCKKLVYFESTTEISSAISREKQIKKGSRQKKIQLIESINPDWVDLSEMLF
jgi:putative endonuclease